MQPSTLVAKRERTDNNERGRDAVRSVSLQTVQRRISPE
jgi:hypothetical protein